MCTAVNSREKQMIRAAFFDIDGTLVSFHTHAVPESALEALETLKKKGILVFAATGRAKTGLQVLGGFPFDGYVTLNGQYCFLPDGTVILENTICREDLLVLKHELKMHPFPCGFETAEGKVFNYRDARVDEVHAVTHNDDQPAGDISHVEDAKVYQAMAFVDEQKEERLMKKLVHCTSARWHPLFCDISPLGGTKVKGMDCFAAYYGFTMAETLAVGDGGNDAAMLRHAGYACAMENGSEEAKEPADYVTADPDHDGILQCCRHYNLTEGEQRNV